MPGTSESSDRLQPSKPELRAQATLMGGMPLIQHSSINTKKDREPADNLIHNQLYPEIMSLIFRFSIQAHGQGQTQWEEAYRHSQYPHGYFTPLLLGAVCRKWRNIAWSTPGLWNTFFILLDSRRSPKQAQTAQQWLNRSGDLPLTLYMARKNIFSEHYDPSESHLPLIDTISQFSSRWNHLFLFGSCTWISQICGKIPEGPFTSLRTLKLTPTKQAIDGLFQNRTVLPPFFSLSLAHKRDSDLKDFNVDWSNVTHLELNWVDVKDCINILETAPQLKHLEIEDFHEDSEVCDASNPVVHHDLQYFNSRSRYSRYSCTRFLPMVTFPRLKQLCIQFIRLSDHEGAQTAEILTSFFERSSCSLTHLSLVDSSLSDRELIHILKTVPSLEHLQIVIPFWFDADISKLPGPLLDYLGESVDMAVSSTNQKYFLPNLQSLKYLFTIPDIPWSRFPRIFSNIKFFPTKERTRPLDTLDIVSSTLPISHETYYGSEDEGEAAIEVLDEVDNDLIDQSTVLRFMELQNAGININIYNAHTKEDLLKRAINFHKIPEV